MSRFDAVSIQYPDAVPELWSSPPANGRHVFRLTIGTSQQVWIGDEDFDPSTQLAAGQVWINAPVADRGIPTISMTPGITSGRSNISGGTYQFLDDLGEFDDWLQNRAANGIQLFGKTLEHFIINQGDSLITDEEIERARWYTWVVKGSIQLDGRVYRIKCEDVFRDLEREIFVPRSHRLMRTAEPSGDVLIYLTDEEAQDLANATWLFEHGSDYVVHPGETRAIGLFQSDNRHEYISWTGISDHGITQVLDDGVTIRVYRLDNPVRGLFGSTPQEWTVDNDQPVSSRQELKAVPFAEEHFLSMVRAVSVGETLDGRAFPWSLNIDDRFIEASSLCDNVDDTRMTFLFPEKQKCKDFIEEHCLARRGLLVPNSRGALYYVPMPIGSSGSRFILSEVSVYGEDASTLTHDDSDTATGVIIEWDRDPVTDELKKTTEFIEPAASDEISALEPVTVEAPYLTTNRSTEGEIFAQARVLHSRHARPVKRLTTKPPWNLAHLPPGTAGYVSDLPVVDYAVSGSAPRRFTGKVMVGSVRRNHHSEELTWDLVGFRSLPPALAAPTATQLPESEYIANGTPIQASGGVAGLGQIISLGTKYYHLGDLHLPTGWPLAFVNTGDFELWVRGVLTWGADVDLSGRGGAGGTATLSTGNAGQRRYVIARSAGGSVVVRTNRFTNSSGDPQGVDRRTLISRPPAIRGAQTMEPLVASVERGRLVGLPPTLSGSGGDAGDASSFRGTKAGGDVVPSDTVTLPGSDAGNGSGSIKLVCAAGSGFVGDGKMRLNGLDGDSPTSRYGAFSGAGAGGAHGFVAVFHDTAGTPFSFNAIRLEAKHGKSQLNGTAAPESTYITRNTPATRSLYDPPTDDTNEWFDAHSVQFLSSSEVAQDSSYGSIWDEFFQRQLDEEVELIPSAVDTSDANLGDIRVDPQYQSTFGETPPARIFTPNGWDDFDWDSRYAAVYRSLLLFWRETGGTRLVNSTNGRPTNLSDGDAYRDAESGNIFIWRADGNDELFLVGGDRVSDDRNPDPVFTEYAITGDTYIVRQGQDLYTSLPLFPTDGTTSGTGSGAGTGTTFDLPALHNFEVQINGPDRADIFIGVPGDLTDITGFEIRRDGNLIATIAVGQPYFHQDTGLTGATQYTWTARAIGAGGIRGPDRADTKTTEAGAGGGGGGGNTLDAVDNLNVAVFSSTAAEATWVASTSAGTTNHEVYLDSVLVFTHDQNGTSYFMSSLTPNTSYVLTVRAVGGGEQSDDVPFNFTTNP